MRGYEPRAQDTASRSDSGSSPETPSVNGTTHGNIILAQVNRSAPAVHSAVDAARSLSIMMTVELSRLRPAFCDARPTAGDGVYQQQRALHLIEGRSSALRCLARWCCSCCWSA